MLVVTDSKIPLPCKASLESRGFRVLPLPPFSALDPRVASHPDMLILPLHGHLFAHERYYKEASAELCRIAKDASLSLTLTSDEIGKEYPRDVRMNAAVIGNNIIGKKDAVSHEIIDLALRHQMHFENVKQGYAKCSSVVLGDKAMITADRGIAAACRALSLDALEIKSGSVLLDGYDYGFIGGASGVYDKTVFFCGDLSLHPDGDNIVAFCQKHGFEAVSLSKEPLYDVGTLFFF